MKYDEKDESYFPSLILKIKFTTTAANNANANTVGPNRSSIPDCPRFRIVDARQ